jgi:hypothetical protein
MCEERMFESVDWVASERNLERGEIRDCSSLAENHRGWDVILDVRMKNGVSGESS